MGEPKRKPLCVTAQKRHILSPRISVSLQPLTAIVLAKTVIDKKAANTLKTSYLHPKFVFLLGAS